jgi:hypothetical protein
MSDLGRVVIIIVNVRGGKAEIERRESCSTSRVCLPSVEGSGEEARNTGCVWTRVGRVSDTNASATMGILVRVGTGRKSVIRKTIRRASRIGRRMIFFWYWTHVHETFR